MTYTETQRQNGTTDHTERIITYAAANGHLLEWYEDAARPGKPARDCAWQGRHSDRCPCEYPGNDSYLPDW